MIVKRLDICRFIIQYVSKTQILFNKQFIYHRQLSYYHRNINWKTCRHLSGPFTSKSGYHTATNIYDTTTDRNCFDLVTLSIYVIHVAGNYN